MADLSKIVCLEQDCRHGAEQTGGSGSGNDTYTKAEIDSKDADIRAAASEAKSVANNAQNVNQTQDGQIKALQEAVDNLHNYEHPAYSANQLGFYKFANDEKGHITDAEEVTASDLYNAGGVIQSSLNLYDYIGYIPLSFMTLYYGGGLKDIAEIDFDRRDDNKRRVLRLCLGSREDRSTGCLRLIDYNGCQYDLRPNPDSPGAQMYGFYLPKQSGTLALTKDIPDISGKQDKSTAVTHTANTAVGSATKPVYIAANGAATPISHSINSDVPANAKFTDTTYSDATQSKPGLMSATDKTNLNANTLARHTHSNKATLDKLTDAQLTKLDGIDPDLYLPKAGGVMTGDIDMKANKRDILVGTHKANTSSGTPIACGTIDTDKKFDEMLPTMRSYIGTYHYKTSSAEAWYDMISVRHRNGHSDGSNWGMYIYAKLFGGNLQWNLNTNKNTWQGERTLLDSVNYTSYAAKSSHTHEMIVNNSKLIAGSNNAAQWCRLGTLTSFENFSTAVISVWSGDGANGNASQNSWFEIHIKDGWQSTQSTTKACGVTVYRTHCDKVKVKVIPTAHNTFTVWVYLPWAYWNGNYAVNGRYKTWTTDFTHQTAEPEGTGADTAYYDQAFLTSTVAKATEATALAETAWTDVPETNISPRYGKNIKYLKSGNTVYVRGSISFSASLNNPCCGTMPSELLPDDYQDHVFTAWNLKGGVPTAYPVVLGTDGKIILMNPTSTANWFVAGRAYNFNFNYHIG